MKARLINFNQAYIAQESLIKCVPFGSFDIDAATCWHLVKEDGIEKEGYILVYMSK